jgi:hypothetical protein
MVNPRAKAGDVIRVKATGREGVILSAFTPWFIALEPDEENSAGTLGYFERKEFEILDEEAAQAWHRREVERAARVLIRAMKSGGPILAAPASVVQRAAEIFAEEGVGSLSG